MPAAPGGAPHAAYAARVPSASAALLVAASVVMAGCTVLTALRWWDVDVRRRYAPPVVYAQALVPWAALGAVAALVVALATARPWLAAAAGALLLVHLGLAAPAWSPARAGARPEDDEPDLVLASLNMEFGRADPRAVVDLVRRLDVDVLVLVEVSPEGRAAVDAAGLAEDLPREVGRAAHEGVGTLLRSRWPLQPLPAPGDRGTAEPGPGEDRSSDNPLALARLGHDEGVPVVAVRGVHPFYPAWEDVGPWRRQLADLERWTSGWADGSVPAGLGLDPRTPLVVAGDLNATVDHPALRGVVRHLGLASRLSGGGRPRTWPMAGPVSGLAALDHVLVRGLRVLGSGTARVPGTDHAAVWARLRLDDR